MSYTEVIFSFFGGLGLFLYAMSLLSSGMQKACGGHIRQMIKKFTKTPVRGALVGVSVTALIQSSSITTVIAVSLINSGLLTLREAVGIIMGANIGTTVTAQLVAFPIGKFAMPIIAIGALIFLFKDKGDGGFGKIILGFGLLFLGMETMKIGVAPLRESEFFLSMLTEMSVVPLLGILAGAIFTGIIQSSSATTAIVIAMAQEDVIGLSAAIPLIFGANIGTCVTALLASFGANRSAKRAAFVHILFNVAGVVLFLPFLGMFEGLIAGTSGDVARQIANGHTVFNIVNTLVFLPFAGAFIAVVKRLVPGSDDMVQAGPKFIDDHYLSLPSVALQNVEKEVERMGQISLEMLLDARKVFFENRKDLVPVVNRNEDIVDGLLRSIGMFSTKLSQKELSPADAERLTALMHNITDIERVGDHSVNIVECAEKVREEDVEFSDDALRDLNIMFDDAISIYKNALLAAKSEDLNLVNKVMIMEDVLDFNDKDFEHTHMARLKNKKCNPPAGVLFTEVLHNLERIGDHSVNLVDRVR